METIIELIQTFIHLDQQLPLISQFGAWLYPALFAIVFFETGLMVMSLLPGDSLLFGAGTLAALGSLELLWLLALAYLATSLADSLNYFIGRHIGRRLLFGRLSIIQPRHIAKTERFFAQRGRGAIVLARFVPWVRSLTPFVAGMAVMPYHRFLFYNLAGGLVWVSFFVLGGYFFGNVPLVRENLPLILVVVVVLSTLPAVVGISRERGVLARIRSGSHDRRDA